MKTNLKYFSFCALFKTIDTRNSMNDCSFYIFYWSMLMKIRLLKLDNILEANQ